MGEQPLKPCPFCCREASSAGIVRYTGEMVREQERNQSEFYFCNCRSCGVSNRGTVGFPTRDQAIEAWNSRTAIPAAGVIEEIAAERERQIEVEGWTPEHDDEHSSGEIARAAAAYALAASYSDFFRMKNHAVDKLREKYAGGRVTQLREIWPWDWNFWKPKDRRGDLIRAGALIVAEIERLDRSTATIAQEGT